MDRPFFSILMAVYNCEDTVLAAVDSVLCEKRVPLELVVCDDASTDGTPGLLDAYAERDSRLRVLHRTENGGDGPARNAALAEVGGEWLILLDSDDLIEEGALAKLAPILADTAADVIIDCFSCYDASRDCHYEERGAFRGDLVGCGSIDPSELADSLYTTVRPSIANKIFRMERIRETGLRFQDIPRVGDLLFTLGACSLARGIEFVDASHYLYRINHGESLTWTGDRYPRCFSQAASALQDLLVENGLWDRYKHGYRDWFVNGAVYNLSRMYSYEGFSALATELCETGFDRVGLTDLDRDDCSETDHYDSCMQLWKKGPSEDLFFRMLAQYADFHGIRRVLARIRSEEGAVAIMSANCKVLGRRALRVLKRNARAARKSLGSGKGGALDRVKRFGDILRYASLPAAAPTPVLPDMPESDEPFASIIVPVYNAEPYLRFCLDSIRAQTFGDFEAILVDDGSTDSSGEVCEEYARADERFRVIHRENGGLSAARNTGIDDARGAWLSFVDADDWIHPEFLECMVSAVLSTESDIAICANYRFERDSELSLPGRHGGRPSYHDEPIVRSSHEMLQLLEEYGPWYYMTAWAKLYRRSIFDELRFPEGRLYEDEFTTPKAIHLCERTVEIGRVLYGYRLNPNGIIQGGFSLKRCDRVASQEEKMAFFLEIGEQECYERARRNRDNMLDWLIGQAREHGMYAALPEYYRKLHARLHGRGEA